MSKLKQFCVEELNIPETSVAVLGAKYILEHIKDHVVPGTTPEKLLEWCIKYDSIKWGYTSKYTWEHACKNNPPNAKLILGNHIYKILNDSAVVKETIRCLN